MKFSTRSKYILLTLLAILNAAIRLPTTTHERGVDSFFIHSLATSISTFGRAKWIIHPTSFMGFYPFSYSSASPFILSGISQSTGIDMEYTILFFGIILGLISIFFSFLVAKEIYNDELCAFLVAFVFSLSPIFLGLTSWGGSTRNLFIAYLPLYLWILLKLKRNFLPKYIIIFALATIFILSTHRLSFFLPIILISFFITNIFLFIWKKIRKLEIGLNPSITYLHFFYIIIITSLFSLGLIFSDIGFFKNSISAYYEGALFSGNDVSTVILNLLADYFGKNGIVLIFGLIGFFVIIAKKKKDFGIYFLIMTSIFLMPLVTIEDYTPEIFLIFISLFIGYGILGLINATKTRKKYIHLPLILICLLGAVGFNIFILNYQNVTSNMPDETYALTIFLKEYSNGSSAADHGLLSAQISGFTGMHSLPYGGGIAATLSPEQLIFDTINKDEVKVRKSSFSELMDQKQFFRPLNSSNAKNDWVSIMMYDKELIRKYDIKYAIKYNFLGNNYWYWRDYNSRLKLYLSENGNSIYVNGRETVYTV